MWSTSAVVLGAGGVLAGLVAAELEEPLFGSPRAGALVLACGALLGAATLLTLLGLTSWHWTAAAFAVPLAVGVIRFLVRHLPDASVGAEARDELLRRHGPRGL